MSKERLIVGWKEWVLFPELESLVVEAKVDTGAKTSALHAFELETFEGENGLMVRFGIHPVRNDSRHVIYCTAPVIDQRTVTDSGGHKEERVVIQTIAKIGKRKRDIQLTLTNRDSMAYRMLLGRSALREFDYLVDSKRRYVRGKELENTYEAFIEALEDEDV